MPVIHEFFDVRLSSFGSLDFQTLKCAAKAVNRVLTFLERSLHEGLAKDQGDVSIPRAGNSLEVGCLEHHAGEIFRGNPTSTWVKHCGWGGFHQQAWTPT